MEGFHISDQQRCDRAAAIIDPQQRPSLTLGQNRDKSSSGFHYGASDGGGEECVGMFPLCLGLRRLLSGAGVGGWEGLKDPPFVPSEPRGDCRKFSNV